MPIFETRVLRSLTFLFVLLLVAFRGQETSAVDLVVIHANVITMDVQLPAAEAVAIDGEKIVAVASANTTRGARMSPRTMPDWVISTRSVAVMLPATRPTMKTDFAKIAALMRAFGPMARL